MPPFDLRTSSSLTTPQNNPDDQFRGFFETLRLEESVAPIPYDKSHENASIADAVISDNETTTKLNHKKVTVVGCGQVGMAIAFAMLTREVAGAIALVDVNKSKLEGEAKDLRQGSAFHQRVRIEASNDYAISQDSHLVIVTAGVAQKVGESRLSLVERNVNIMKMIIPQVLKYSPNAPICIVSNPCDIMTAVAAKIAGPSIPPGRIFGSGTCLDSSRIRSMIAKALDIDSKSVHGYIIGEHGDSSVPVWSAMRVGGIPFLKEGQEPSKMHHQLHREVVESAGDVIALKGYTNWAVGLAATHIAQAVLSDTHSILPLSTCVRGLYGIEEDVFLSLPCSVGAGGLRRVLPLPLTELEKAGLLKSKENVWNVQQGVWDSV